MNKSVLKKVIGDIEVTRDLTLLLVIGGLYALSFALSNTFVNVYLWKQSGEFVDIALYNLGSVVMQPFAFILAGRVAKKIDRVVVLRAGVITLAIFFSTVLYLGDQANQYLLLLGALIGTGVGFYWLAFNVLTFEITEPETRDFFNGFLGLLTSFAGMIGPILAGFIITRMEQFTGYTVIFTISLSLFVAAVLTSFLLQRRSAEGQFYFRRILKERKNNPNWKQITRAHFFQGLREGTFVFVIVVWVYIATGSELAIGTYGLVASAVQFVAYYIITRIIKPTFRKKLILVGGMILYAAIFLIVLGELTFTKLIMYGVVVSIAYPMLLVPYVSLTFDVIGKGWKAAEMRIEYIVVRELFVNSGRIVSVLAFLATITFFSEEKGIPALLLILGAGHAVIYFFVRHVRFKDGNGGESYTFARQKGGDGDPTGGSKV
ncbi:MFS transporter [Halalkalibacter akibai]|uniref:Membrane protein n=1 Tax=Halalkalibacter akibai (strain ATCC 43226 / DSM 21942 / CIP 109018 / JCM 9157 / 1139) TaxID=1236973 RepID=W4QMX2_HALA3|nr:MFS transporter [Halalkalibacter akibai]GAE33445.1 membrane protein [Halalkalibacter akibai JCM 9157]